jgi:two-component system, sensor histidine kinase PdtaS
MEKFLAVLPERPQPPSVRYGWTALIMIISCLAQLGVGRYAGFSGFFLLLPGIFAAGLLFDRGSAFFATAIGAMLAWYLFTPSIHDPRTLLPLGLFLITGMLFAVVSEGLRKVLEQLSASEREKDLLLQELGHRNKNNIMSIASLLTLQSRGGSNEAVRNALEAAANRVRVMAEVHDHLKAPSGDRPVAMAEYLAELCQKLGDMLRGARPVAIKVFTEPLELPERKAVPIAIIVNELVTNSLKYAFPDDRPGTIEVKMEADGEITLSVHDNGIGCNEKAKDGLGTRLMQLMTEQLGGTLKRETDQSGCRATLRIPRSRRAK